MKSNLKNVPWFIVVCVAACAIVANTNPARGAELELTEKQAAAVFWMASTNPYFSYAVNANTAMHAIDNALHPDVELFVEYAGADTAEIRTFDDDLFGRGLAFAFAAECQKNPSILRVRVCRKITYRNAAPDSDFVRVITIRDSVGDRPWVLAR